MLMAARKNGICCLSLELIEYSCMAKFNILQNKSYFLHGKIYDGSHAIIRKRIQYSHLYANSSPHSFNNRSLLIATVPTSSQTTPPAIFATSAINPASWVTA